jgi:hypothetical protein
VARGRSSVRGCYKGLESEARGPGGPAAQQDADGGDGEVVGGP